MTGFDQTAADLKIERPRYELQTSESRQHTLDPSIAAVYT